ncbi:hypothetical protein [Hyalangium minutum]|uniref:Transporter n=1 Tax=Hyalangium minutum TaxID=394096 RepID=A0A085WMT5_9BACT|nr:hypothetical protein [Hyalangium minutum]KFE68998.1 hypothetical protein DB31_6900 [Hyalangium minutum]
MWKSCVALLPVALLLLSSPARACASCACGDPTLTTMGTEQPFSGRLRVAAVTRAWGQTVGDDSLDAVTLRELRVDVSAAYAPLPWLMLSATLPLQARTLRDVSLTREQALGPGDLEVSAKLFVFRDRAFSPDHLLSVLVGSELPTSPTLRDAQGTPLSIDAQLGTGSVDPFVGLAYTTFQGAWSFVVSTTGTVSTEGRLGFRSGASLRSTLAAQFQPSTSWALRVAADTRLEGASTLLGERDTEGSGFIGYLSPEFLFSPTTDMVLQLGVRAPVLNLLSGRVRQTPIVQAAVAFDL